MWYLHDTLQGGIGLYATLWQWLAAEINTFSSIYATLTYH